MSTDHAIRLRLVFTQGVLLVALVVLGGLGLGRIPPFGRGVTCVCYPCCGHRNLDRRSLSFQVLCVCG